MTILGDLRDTSVAGVRRRIRKVIGPILQRTARSDRLGAMPTKGPLKALHVGPARQVEPPFAWQATEAARADPFVAALRARDDGPIVAVSLERDAIRFSLGDRSVAVARSDARQTSGTLPAPVQTSRWRPCFFPQIADTSARPLDPTDEGSLHLGRLSTAHHVPFDPPSWGRPELTLALAQLAAAGVPLVATTGAVAEPHRLGDHLAAAIGSTVPTSDLEREAISIRLRRAALLDHGPERRIAQVAEAIGCPTPKFPSVSVLLPTRRPQYLLDAISQIAAQTEVEVQLIVGLHGYDIDARTERRLAKMPIESLVVHRVASHRPLGAVLDDLAERADGELLSKWDDDDWYGRHHLIDLVLAHRYSGADVVGKAAEFVFLEPADLTIRRWPVGAEAPSSTLAGGTLLTSATWLGEIGGWEHVPRGVDRRLLEATRRSGGRCYRSHGHEYVLRRTASDGHTWNAPLDYFLREATERRVGLDLPFAGIEP